MVAASGLHGSVAAQTESQLQTMQSSSGGRVREREGLGVHFTVRRPKLSIRRPIPTVLILVKRGTVQTTVVFSDTYLRFENRSANAQF